MYVGQARPHLLERNLSAFYSLHLCLSVISGQYSLCYMGSIQPSPFHHVEKLNDWGSRWAGCCDWTIRQTEKFVVLTQKSKLLSVAAFRNCVNELPNYSSLGYRCFCPVMVWDTRISLAYLFSVCVETRFPLSCDCWWNENPDRSIIERLTLSQPRTTDSLHTYIFMSCYTCACVAIETLNPAWPYACV